MISTKVIVIQIFLLTAAAAYKYDILFRDETIFSPCDIPNVKSIDDYFDYSKTSFEFLNNGSLYVHGSYELIKDIGSDNNPLRVQGYKKIRGSWVNTIYSIYREDLCKSFLDLNDLAYNYVKDITPEERTCPFYKGKILTVNAASDLTIDIPDSRFGSEIKIEIIINFKGITETLCANIYAEIYKT